MLHSLCKADFSKPAVCKSRVLRTVGLLAQNRRVNALLSVMKKYLQVIRLAMWCEEEITTCLKKRAADRTDRQAYPHPLNTDTCRKTMVCLIPKICVNVYVDTPLD